MEHELCIGIRMKFLSNRDVVRPCNLYSRITETLFTVSVILMGGFGFLGMSFAPRLKPYVFVSLGGAALRCDNL